jgi:hypothetical protein
VEGWALAVAVVAAAFSIYAFFRQFALQRRVTDIEQARREEEVASRLVADVTVSFDRDRTATAAGGRALSGDRLIINNRGPATAREANIEADAQGWGVMKDAVQPPVTLDADQKYPIPVARMEQSQPSTSFYDGRTEGELEPSESPLAGADT